jgi:NADPH-dependent 7-cyano-7-deazaguanine reductase QueF-like protein
MMPSEIVKGLQELTAMTRKGVEALFEAEVDLAEAERALDLAESKAFLESQGTVADRQALAKFESVDARFERDLCRAKVNRVRTKLKSLEGEIMAQATMSKIMQAEMKL